MGVRFDGNAPAHPLQIHGRPALPDIDSAPSHSAITSVKQVTSADPQLVKRGPRADDIFFVGMALLILALVFAGFADSYILPGMVLAALPNLLVHIHGALFVCWIFLLVAQTWLVATRRIRLHMTAGLLAMLLLPVLYLFGVLTLFDSIRRAGTPVPPEIILVGDLEELTLFALLTTWGFLARRNPIAHKRLMILGTLAMTGPAIDRIEQPFGMFGTIGIYVALPMLLVGYDLWSRKQVQRVTWIGYGLIALGMLTLLPLSSLPIWQHCLDWIKGA